VQPIYQSEDGMQFNFAWFRRLVSSRSPDRARHRLGSCVGHLELLEPRLLLAVTPLEYGVGVAGQYGLHVQYSGGLSESMQAQRLISEFKNGDPLQLPSRGIQFADKVQIEKRSYMNADLNAYSILQFGGDSDEPRDPSSGTINLGASIEVESVGWATVTQGTLIYAYATYVFHTDRNIELIIENT
jgi:hypothetical protein